MPLIPLRGDSTNPIMLSANQTLVRMPHFDGNLTPTFRYSLHSCLGGVHVKRAF